MRHAVLLGESNQILTASDGFGETFGFSDVSKIAPVELAHPDFSALLLDAIEHVRRDGQSRELASLPMWVDAKWVELTIQISKGVNSLRLDFTTPEPLTEITAETRPADPRSDQRLAQELHTAGIDADIPGLEVADSRSALRKNLALWLSAEDPAMLEIDRTGTVLFCAGNWQALGLSHEPEPPTLTDLAQLIGNAEGCAALSKQLSNALAARQTAPVPFTYDEKTWIAAPTGIPCPHTVGKFNALLAIGQHQE